MVACSAAARAASPTRARPSLPPRPRSRSRASTPPPLTPRERREWAAQVSELLAPCPRCRSHRSVREREPPLQDLPPRRAAPAQAGPGRQGEEGAGRRLPRPLRRRQDQDHRHRAARPRSAPPTRWSPSSSGPTSSAPSAAPSTPCSTSWCTSTRRRCGSSTSSTRSAPTPTARSPPAPPWPRSNQGKFWEMHHLLFDNQEHLEQADLETLRQGSSASTWGSSAPTSAPRSWASASSKDKKQADELGLDGTPVPLHQRPLRQPHATSPRRTT